MGFVRSGGDLSTANHQQGALILKMTVCDAFFCRRVGLSRVDHQGFWIDWSLIQYKKVILKSSICGFFQFWGAKMLWFFNFTPSNVSKFSFLNCISVKNFNFDQFCQVKNHILVKFDLKKLPIFWNFGHKIIDSNLRHSVSRKMQVFGQP